MKMKSTYQFGLTLTLFIAILGVILFPDYRYEKPEMVSWGTGQPTPTPTAYEWFTVYVRLLGDYLENNCRKRTVCDLGPRILTDNAYEVEAEVNMEGAAYCTESPTCDARWAQYADKRVFWKWIDDESITVLRDLSYPTWTEDNPLAPSQCLLIENGVIHMVDTPSIRANRHNFDGTLFVGDELHYKVNFKSWIKDINYPAEVQDLETHKQSNIANWHVWITFTLKEGPNYENDPLDLIFQVTRCEGSSGHITLPEY